MEVVVPVVLMQVVSIGVITGVVHHQLGAIDKRLDKLEAWLVSVEKRLGKRD